MFKKKTFLVLAAVIILAAVSVYWPVYRYPFIMFDDDEYVTENKHAITGLTATNLAWAFGSSHAGFWIPLTWISLMADAELYGQNAGGYHLTNLTLHITNALLLCFFMAAMTGTAWIGGLAGLLLAVHPLHVESVAWITERKDVLALFFGLAAGLAYLRYVRSPSRRNYGLCVACWAFSLMAKPMLVTFPVLLLLLDYWPLGRMNRANIFFEKLPLLALSAGISIVTVATQSGVGALKPLAYYGIGSRLANAAAAYLSYHWKMAWPLNQSIMYLAPPEGYSPWAILASIGMLIMVAKLLWRRRLAAPYLITGWLWFIVALVPSVGIIQAGPQSCADRFVYAPAIGLYLALALSLREIGGREKRLMPGLFMAVAAAVFLMAAMGAHQVTYWRSGEVLFGRAVALNAQNWLARHNLGTEYFRAGLFAQAEEQYLKVVEIKPNYPVVHANLGKLYELMGRREEAVDHWERALRISPDDDEIIFNLALAKARLGKNEEARDLFEEIVGRQPGNAEAHYNLGAAFMKLGVDDRALESFRWAVHINPQDHMARYNIAILLKKSGRISDALLEAERILTMRPTDAQAYALAGVLCLELGLNSKAAGYLQRSLTLREADPETRFYLGQAKEKQGDGQGAGREYELAFELQPDLPGLKEALKRNRHR